MGLTHINSNFDGIRSNQTAAYPRFQIMSRYLFNVYIFLLIVLPTGDLKGINVKVLLSILLFGFVLRMLYQRGMGKVELAVLFILPIFLIAQILNASIYGFADTGLSLSHANFILATIAGCWFISKFVSTEQREDCLGFVRLVVSSLAVVACLKTVIVVYGLNSGIPIYLIMQRISVFFGVQLMSGDSASIGGRIEFVSDTLLPVALFALLYLRKELRINAVLATLMLALLIFSDLISYSRFFWFHAAIALVLGLSSVRRDKINLFYIALIGLLCLLSFDWILLLVSERFSTMVAGTSDMERATQIRALTDFFWEAPWFGHGLGTYTTRSIRDPKGLFGYEVQLLALCGQIGIAGVCFLFSLLLYYCRSIFRVDRGQVWYRVCLLLLLATTLLGGIFNPYLTNSTASIAYGMIMVLAEIKA